MDDLLAAARATLERIKILTTQVGLTYVELPEFLAGVGIAIGFASTRFTVLSVMGGGSENQINVTAGILRDIQQDRLSALALCNGMVRDNPAYPVYLHEAEIGWDILVSNIFPVSLLINNPAFFVNSVKALPMMADTVRPEFAEAGLGGQVFNWDADDRQRLFIESMM
jgi:hypothetical protein